VGRVRHGRLAGRRLALASLVLVVGEEEVLPAAVQVDGVAEGCLHHRRALNMPARPPGAPRAVPGRLARLGALPEGEIARVALAGLQLLAGADEGMVE